MANNTEIVAKVIASSILLNEERQLLRVRDVTVPAASPKPAAQPPAALANDAKAVSAVLLKLLDERIQAAADDGATEQGGRLAVASTDDTKDNIKSARVGARYAENGAVTLADPQIPQRTEINPAIVANTPLTAAPELQTFLQRLAAATAQKSGGSPAQGFASQLLQGFGSNGVPLLIAGAAATLVVWLGVIVIGWLLG